MTKTKTKNKIALLLSFVTIAALAIVLSLGGGTYAKADEASWAKGKNVQAEGGHFTLADYAPGEQATPPLGGYTLENTTDSETYSFKYNSQSGDVNKEGDNWAAAADTDATNVPVWTLKIDLAAAVNGNFALPVYYVGGNGVWVMMCFQDNEPSNLIYGPTDNFSGKRSGYRLDSAAISRGSSDTSVVEWDGSGYNWTIKANGGGTAYLYGHFWYSSACSENAFKNNAGDREVSLGDLVIKVIVNAETKDPLLENGAISLKEEAGAGYSLQKAEAADYDYTLKLNTLYKNDYSFQVNYGNADESYLLTGDAINGYGIAAGDCNRASTDNAVADWSGDAVNYTVAVPQGVTEGETIVNCEIFVPAAVNGIFGTVEAKTVRLGEFKVKVIVEKTDLTNYFKFTRAQKGSEADNMYLYGYNIPEAEWNNLEQFLTQSNTAVFFDNVVYKPAGGQELTLTQLSSKDLAMQVHMRDDHIEFYLKDTDARPVPFGEGDTLILKKGMRLLERYGAAGDQCRPLNDSSKEYYELQQDQEYVFENGAWSIDQCSIDSIAISDSVLAVDHNGTKELSVTVVAGVKADDTVTWSIADDTVLSYEYKTEGDTHTIVLTGLKVSADPVDVTATTVDGQKVTCAVTVVDPTVVSSVTRVGNRNREVNAGATVTLEVTVQAGSQADTTVTWSSSNTAVATVNANGVVTGVAAGTAEITATCGGKSAAFTVTVKATSTTPDPTPDPDGDGNNTKPEETKKKKKCGGSAAASATGAAVALMLAAGVVLLSRKKARN